MKATLCLLFVTGLLAQQPSRSITGKCHLLQLSDDEVNVPAHRIDFIFREQGTLTGAVINRNTGQDIPLAKIKFDGTKLTLQMADLNGNSVPVVLTMTPIDGKFEDYYLNEKSEKFGPNFKLIRFRE